MTDAAVEGGGGQSADALLSDAVARHRAGNLDEAQQLYRRILSADPAHADARHLSGIAAYQAGEPERAAACFRLTLATEPSFAPAYNSLGNLFADRARPDDAARAYRRAIALQDGYAEALGNLGLLLQAQERIGDAVAAYEEALRADPGRTATRFDLAVLYRRLGRLDEAALAFYRVVQARPDHREAWRSLALVLWVLGHSDAELCLRRALADDPTDREVARALGTLLNGRGAFADAVTVLAPAVEADAGQDARLIFHLGSALQGEGRLAEAVVRYRDALSKDPQLAGGWNNLGVALLDLGDHTAAVAALRTCLALHPTDAVAFNNLGTGLDGIDRPAEAARVFQRALTIQPDYGKALNNLGNSRRVARRAEAAAALYRRALIVQPDYPDSYTNLGNVLKDGDDWPGALRLHRRAVRLAPRSAIALTTLGLALNMLGRNGEAEAAHRRALSIDVTHAEAYANLGMLQWQSMRVAEAERTLRRALHTDPTLAAARLNFALVSLATGNLREGWPAYQDRFKAKDLPERSIGAPLWQDDGATVPRLLVWREQGVGDEIMFASSYPTLADRVAAGRVGRVVLECDHRLVSLFARSFPWATVRADSSAADGAEAPVPADCDAHIAAGALPRLLRPDLARFPTGPWLVPDPERLALWRERLAALGPGLRVGIAWRSQLMTTERKAAYITLEAFAPLFTIPGVNLVNLQYGDCAAEIAAAEARFGVTIHRWDDLNLKDDFEGAAALTAALDLVIAPAVSTGELAGALGVPAWRIGARDWTQLGAGVRPWYPSMRLFQPRAGETLETVMARVARTLHDLARPVQAVASCPSVAPAAPPDVEPLIAEAVARYRAGALQEAEDRCRAVLDAVPDHSVALHLSGILRLRQGDAEAAAAILALAVRADPGNAAAHAALADACQALGRHDAARTAQRNAVLLRPDAAEHWLNRAALLRGLGEGADAEACARRALRIRPQLGVAHAQLGHLLAEREDREGAERSHRRALALAPSDADALVSLGAFRLRTDRPAEAERLLRLAAASAPDSAAAWSHLGSALDRLGRVEEALACHRRAVDRAPAMAEAQANLALHWARRQRPVEAIDAYRQAIRLNPALPTAHYNLSLLLLEQGELRSGWLEHEWRFDTPQFHGQKRHVAARSWRGENIASSRLLVWREQGVGDEILFASCYPDLLRRAGHLVVECDRRLVSLFARSFPGATVRAPTVEPRDVDVQVAAASLPRLLRSDRKRFPAQPWLVPDPGRLDRWRDRLAALGPGLKVGIAWRSQIMDGERRAAYVTLDAFAPLFALPGVVFVNLQYGDCAAEIAAAEARFGVTIHRWDDLDLKDDFEGAAALTATLDLVLTPAISTGELAGALGVPVWRIGHRDWTQLGTGVRPWFPSMRLFQPRPGEGLDDVMGRMASTLRRLMPPDDDPPPGGLPRDVPDDPDGLLETAAAHHREGRLAEAAPLYERVLKVKTDHPVALHLSGLLAHQTGDSAAGAARIARALDALPAYGAAQSSLGTVLLALGRAPEAVRRFRLALALQPAAAAALTNLGNALEAAHDLTAAAVAHRRATLVDPALAEAHDNWGAVLTRLGALDLAEERHRHALRLAPDRADGWLNLGVVLRRAGRLDEAGRALIRALALVPALGDALANLGRLLRDRGDAAAAERWCRRALTVEPGQPAAAFNLGLLDLARGRLESGWRGYDARFRARELSGAARALPVPAWEGEDPAGLRLLVWAEQGIGDEILFAGCLDELIARAAAVVVECDRRLVPLFARSFPRADWRPAPVDPDAPCAGIDRHVAMGSLPRWLRPRFERFPSRPSFLTADPERAARWRERVTALGPGLKVGIAWRSGLMTAERRGAYAPLDVWGPVFALPGVVFITLQYGDCAAEIAEAERRFGVTLHRWDDLDLKDDLDGVAALMTALDLVVTPASSVGELAGALGVPVWRFGPRGDWTALGTGVRPWFPTMALIPAPAGEAASGALPTIARRLAALRPV
ncbi:Flp pilus assembly protein TadD [Azospirillum brasilense]|uniref:Flp pilus assembly protein TadD n=1 Tax=Azospirillum brasilense TaxID=192 RepID=A0A560BPB2_AZOBR|nr:tetratricopeptide repeat protein [Azospirillum brasilense]TWA74441.1 Flp pilus assembly protein TadD [Azospirillum brasilense]